MFDKIKKWFRKPYNIELWGGLIWIGEKDTDFKFWTDTRPISDILKDKEIIDRQVKYEYNQWADFETRNWCTIFSAITELSFLFDREFSKCEIDEIWHKMIKDWKLDPDNWAYLSDAIDYTRRWWNEKFPDKLVESYQISYKDKRLMKLLETKTARLTQIWYRTSSALYTDIQADWIAENNTYPMFWWHAVSKAGINIIDNYKWQIKYNRYSFKYFDDLVNKVIIFRLWYIFLKK